MHGGIGCLCAGRWSDSLRRSVTAIQFTGRLRVHAIRAAETVLGGFFVLPIFPPADEHSEIPRLFAIGLVQ